MIQDWALFLSYAREKESFCWQEEILWGFIFKSLRVFMTQTFFSLIAQQCFQYYSTKTCSKLSVWQRQRTKTNPTYGSWEEILFKVPQESALRFFCLIFFWVTCFWKWVKLGLQDILMIIHPTQLPMTLMTSSDHLRKILLNSFSGFQIAK